MTNEDVSRLSDANSLFRPGGSTDPVLRIHLDGGRFTRHCFPATAVSELQRLNRIYTILAEDLWRNAHPERVRLPRGFTRDYELYLTDIGQGSTITTFTNNATDPPADALFEVDNEGSSANLASRAADRVNELFAFIVENQSLPEFLPQSGRPDVLRLFSSLEQDEYCVFETSDGASFTYTHEIRTKLLASVHPGIRTQTGQIAGRLSGIHADKRLASLKLADGTEIPATFLSKDFNDWIDAVAMPTDGKFVAVRGTYALKGNRFDEILTASEIIPLNIPPGAFTDRLLELMTDDADGEVATVDPYLAELAFNLHNGVETFAARPGIFPLEDGGIQLVWRGNGVRRTVDIHDSYRIEARVYCRTNPDRNMQIHWKSFEDAMNGLTVIFDA